jgi:hypothetical protein
MKPTLFALLLVLTSPVTFAQEEPDRTDSIAQEELEAFTTEILAEIEALRGKRFLRKVSVSVADKEEFLRYAVERLNKSSTPEEIASEETIAKMMGLIPVEMNLLDTYLELVESQVGGFYDPESESFCLMESFTGPLAKVILAHELTHALDDQLYDIDGTDERFADNADRQLAFHGVVEGSGTAVMNTWAVNHMSEFRGVDLSAATTIAGAEDTPPFLWRPLMAVYLRGSMFLNRTTSMFKGMQMPEHGDFHLSFTEPPRSTEQLLHPEKYWNPKTIDEPIDIRFDVEGLQEGWEVIQEDTLGELTLACFVEEPDDRGGMPTNQLAMMSMKYTFAASKGWGGDRYLLLGRGDARILVFETRWDTADDAREFDAALEDLDSHLRKAVGGMRAEPSLSGVERVFDRSGNAVTFYSWFGVEREEVGRILASIRTRIE